MKIREPTKLHRKSGDMGHPQLFERNVFVLLGGWRPNLRGPKGVKTATAAFFFGLQ
jgi:hypothetical protein